MRDFLRRVEAVRFAEHEAKLSAPVSELVMAGRCEVCRKRLGGGNALGICSRLACRRTARRIRREAWMRRRAERAE